MYVSDFDIEDIAQKFLFAKIIKKKKTKRLKETRKHTGINCMIKDRNNTLWDVSETRRKTAAEPWGGAM